jgi:hypothetical protein
MRPTGCDSSRREQALAPAGRSFRTVLRENNASGRICAGEFAPQQGVSVALLAAALERAPRLRYNQM